MGNKTARLWTEQFIFITITNGLIFLAMQMQLSTFSLYVKEISHKDIMVGICSAGYSAAAIMARLFTGFALDRYGRRGMLMTGLIVSPLIMVTYSWVPLIGVLVAIRFIHGLFWGISTTSSTTIASDIINRGRYAEGLAYFTLAQSLTLAISPVIGLLIMKRLGYGTMTYIAAAILALAVIPALLLNYPKENEKAIKQKFIPLEKKAMRPALVMAFVGTAVGSVFVFIPLYGENQGIDVTFFFSVFAASMLLTRPFVGRLVDQYGFNIVAFPSMILLAVSMALLSISSNLAMLLLSGFLIGASYATIQTTLQTMSVVNTSFHRRGAANATFFIAFDAGMGTGGLLSGSIATRFGYSHMFAFMAVPVIVGCILYFLLARKIEKMADEMLMEA